LDIYRNRDLSDENQAKWVELKNLLKAKLAEGAKSRSPSDQKSKGDSWGEMGSEWQRRRLIRERLDAAERLDNA